MVVRLVTDGNATTLQPRSRQDEETSQTVFVHLADGFEDVTVDRHGSQATSVDKNSGGSSSVRPSVIVHPPGGRRREACISHIAYSQ